MEESEFYLWERWNFSPTAFGTFPKKLGSEDTAIVSSREDIRCLVLTCGSLTSCKGVPNTNEAIQNWYTTFSSRICTYRPKRFGSFLMLSEWMEKKIMVLTVGYETPPKLKCYKTGLKNFQGSYKIQRKRYLHVDTNKWIFHNIWVCNLKATMPFRINSVQVDEKKLSRLVRP